jgi:hypothetical protein
MRSSARGPWATAAWGLGIVAAYAAAQVAVIAFLAPSEATAVPAGPALPLAILASSVTGVALVVLAVRQSPGGSAVTYLHLRGVRVRTLAFWLLAAAALVALGDTLNWLLERPRIPEFDRRLYQGVDSKPLLWLAVVVAAPLFEEAFFRGFLLEGWRRSPMGAAGALALTSLLWTLIHVQYGPWEQTWVLAAGILLGAARLRTGSLYVPLAMHAGINALGLAELALLTD